MEKVDASNIEMINACPFCGGDGIPRDIPREYRVRINHNDSDTYHFVKCAFCGAQAPSFSRRGKAIKYWNMKR